MEALGRNPRLLDNREAGSLPGARYWLTGNAIRFKHARSLGFGDGFWGVNGTFRGKRTSRVSPRRVKQRRVALTCLRPERWAPRSHHAGEKTEAPRQIHLVPQRGVARAQVRWHGSQVAPGPRLGRDVTDSNTPSSQSDLGPAGARGLLLLPISGPRSAPRSGEADKMTEPPRTRRGCEGLTSPQYRDTCLVSRRFCASVYFAIPHQRKCMLPWQPHAALFPDPSLLSPPSVFYFSDLIFCTGDCWRMFPSFPPHPTSAQHNCPSRPVSPSSRKSPRLALGSLDWWLRFLTTDAW